MDTQTYRFSAKLWLYPGAGGWHFISLPKEESAEIKARFGPLKSRGWGSIPVMVTVGSSRWKTSIFPSKEGEYILAVKKDIRKKEGLKEGETFDVAVEI